MNPLFLEGAPTLVEQITTFVSSAVSWIGSFAGAVTSNELLTLGVVVVPIAGFGIGAIKRLLRFRA